MVAVFDIRKVDQSLDVASYSNDHGIVYRTRGMRNGLMPRERMLRAIDRQSVDRLPVQINYTGLMGKKLAAHFGCSMADLPRRLDNHLLRVDLTHRRNVHLHDGKEVAYDWWGAGWDANSEGYLHAFAPLYNSMDLSGIDWPDPEDKDLFKEASCLIGNDKGMHFIVPNLGMCLFERAWSLRGFDQFLMDLVTEPAWAEDLLEKITEIQVRIAQRFVLLGVNGGYLGDDYGAQRSMLFSPRIWRRLFKPRLARIFAVFRNAGLPVIFHSDGDIWEILPDLIDIGLSCLNPVQPEVLHHERLFREYGKHLSFYGGISTQNVLPHGTPEEVAQAVKDCTQNLAPDQTGLVLGPSHRMQSDIPIRQIEAMLSAFPIDKP